MVPQHRFRGSRRLASLSALLTALASLSLVAACDKVPLVAPSGAVITLFATGQSVPINGEIEIVATVIENGVTAPPPATPPPANGGGGTPSATNQAGAGTPVHNGTLVSFTTTLGRIEPSEARTHNGQVRVKLISGGQSGAATVTAFSGGASARLENFPIGSAAAERLTLTATNQTLPAAGGSTEVRARVENAGGAPVAGVPVTFTTTAGSVSPTTATTDAEGIARTTLTSTAAADVTARTGSKEGTLKVGIGTRSGLNVEATPQTTTTGTPVTFRITTTEGQAVTNARINYGDGSSRSLGTVIGTRTDTHTYSQPGNYQVTITADNGENAGTSVSVGAAEVTLTATPQPSTPGQIVTFTASAAGAQVRGYRWTFGDGSQTQETTSRTNTHAYSQRGSYTARVEAIGLDGNVIGSANTGITVQGL